MTNEQLSQLEELTSYVSECNWNATEEQEKELAGRMVEKKGEYITMIQRVIDKDNILAKKVGLKEVKLLDIGCSSMGGYGRVWPYIKLDVDGKIVKLTEANLKYAFINDNLEAYFLHCLAKTFCMAGDIDMENCDFIFANYGYSTNGRLYKIIEND